MTDSFGFKIIPIWVLVLITSVLSTWLVSWMARRGIATLNNVVNPCIHGGIYNKTADLCDCSNSNGLFKGKYCGENNCQNFGVLTRFSQAVRDDVISLYGCRCSNGPSSRWTGFLCNQCYASDNSDDVCTGQCDSSTLPFPPGDAIVVPGTKRQCDKVCVVNGDSTTCLSLDLGYNGVCNVCNGHGRCDARAECICDGGWFDSEEGQRCVESCTDAEGRSICGKNSKCEIINGKPKCFCKKGFWNEPLCDVVCPGINESTLEGTACNGHGSCYFDGITQIVDNQKSAFCECQVLYKALDSPACRYECPHKPTVQLPCSGHGVCSMNFEKTDVECSCNTGLDKDTWSGNRCDCNPKYTCFGHGECEPQTGECICQDGGLISELTHTDLDVGIYTYIHDEYVPDTYKFASPAHYVMIESDVIHFFVDMVVNITDGTFTIPITIKTVVDGSTPNQQIGEIQETEAKALAVLFDIHEDIVWKLDTTFDASQNPFNYIAKVPFNWNPVDQPDRGFYTGPRCLQCKHNWYPSPVMGETEETCNVYCNPNSEYEWFDEQRSAEMYPFSGADGFGCWGRGQCEYERDMSIPNKLPSCKCGYGTDPETYCAQCRTHLYPKLKWTANPVKPFCSESCIDNTCNGHGRCNPYAFKNDEENICVCDLNIFGMDTVNASSKCSTCNNNWFPEDPNHVRGCSDFCSSNIQDNMESGCQNLIKKYEDTKEDIELISFNIQRQRDVIINRIPAPELARTINCLNCQAGICGREAQCICPEGVTGVECQKACLTHNGNVCGGHGECSENDLFTHFNPESALTQCECDPEDDYTPDTRDYYQRTGVVLDPPPTKQYYGAACEYHCPTYNQDICAARGECYTTPVEGYYKCKRSIQLSDDENPMSCKNVMSGESQDGVFCSVTSSPWDAKAAEIKAVNYFESPSPGAVQCKSLECQEDINRRDWSQYCTSMLKGLYPAELNGPICSHNKEHDSLCAGLNGHVKCSTALEDAFSRGKSCSDFTLADGKLRVYDAWDVEQMGVTHVIINVKYMMELGNEDKWREMTPFIYNVQQQSDSTYISTNNHVITIKRDVDNTLVIENVGCGDTYGLKWNKILSGESADGTGYLSHTADKCETTDCDIETFTMNPWHGFDEIMSGFDNNDGGLDMTRLLKGGEPGITSGNGMTAEKAAKVAIDNPKYNAAGYFVMSIGLAPDVFYYTDATRNELGQVYRTNDPNYRTYRAGIPISNKDGCCKCNSATPDLLTKAFDTTNTNYFIHTIQLYHDKTWCTMSDEIFENSGALNTDCTGSSSNSNEYEAMNTICHTHVDMFDCTTDVSCIYDLSVEHQKLVKSICSANTNNAEGCDANAKCVYFSSGKCSPRTFCRGKTCTDTINDVGISNFCIDLEIPKWCPAEPSNVKVDYRIFTNQNVHLSNVDPVRIIASTLDDCAREIALLGKDMFEWGEPDHCVWYSAIYNLDTTTDTVTTYRLNGFDSEMLEAYKSQWEDQCFALSSEVTSVATELSSQHRGSDLFFMCWNLNEKNYPFVMASTGNVRGGIKLMHEEQFRAFVTSVGDAKQDDRWNSFDFPSADNSISVNGKWCKNHINTRYPTGDIHSWFDTVKFSKTSGFYSPEFTTICSGGPNQPDINMGYHKNTNIASKHAMFWEKVFKRERGNEFVCSIKDKKKKETWNAGAPYSLKCYRYENNEWAMREEYPMRDPKIRYRYLSKLTPKELESCIMTPNMDSYIWNPPNFDLLSRTRTTCTNVDASSRTILNKAILLSTVNDPSKIIVPPVDSIDHDVVGYLPELLYRSRMAGAINIGEKDIFYLHRRGGCPEDKCILHTAQPYSLPADYFDNVTSIREWCDTTTECDGFTHDSVKDHWYAWSFMAEYSIREYDNLDSYVKASSTEDECHSYVQNRLFRPTQVSSSIYSVPSVSQAVIVENGVLELTKGQAGSVYMDGWTHDIPISTIESYNIAGSNLLENKNKVAYTRVKTPPTSVMTLLSGNLTLDEKHCIDDKYCGGLLMSVDERNEYGEKLGENGEQVYSVDDKYVPIADVGGGMYFAPNFFIFDIDGNYIKNTKPLVSPFDIDILWPSANNYGYANLSCFETWQWTGTSSDTGLMWCIEGFRNHIVDQHFEVSTGATTWLVNELQNPTMSVCAGGQIVFERTSVNHVLRVVKESDCPSCVNGNAIPQTEAECRQWAEQTDGKKPADEYVNNNFVGSYDHIPKGCATLKVGEKTHWNIHETGSGNCDAGDYQCVTSPASTLSDWIDVDGMSRLTYTFIENGTYYYICVGDCSQMVGKIIVSSCETERIVDFGNQYAYNAKTNSDLNICINIPVTFNDTTQPVTIDGVAVAGTTYVFQTPGVYQYEGGKILATECGDGNHTTTHRWRETDSLFEENNIYTVAVVREILTEDGKIHVLGIAGAPSSMKAFHSRYVITKYHVPSSKNVHVTIQPVTLCLENPREVNDGIVWDSLTTDLTGCKFKTTYYANGTLLTVPDGVEMDGKYTVGMVTFTSTSSGTFEPATRETLRNTIFKTSVPLIVKTSSIKMLPFVQFSSEGTVAISFVKDNKESFSMDIVDDLAYINKNFTVDIMARPLPETKWNIKFENGVLSVNDGTIVDLRGNVVPNKIHVWNSITNSSGRIYDVRMGTIDLFQNEKSKWSTKKSMHPGKTYAAVLETSGSQKEVIAMESNNNWTPGDWVATAATQQTSTTVLSPYDTNCVLFAINYDWPSHMPNTGPVRYIHLNNDVCTLYWASVLTAGNGLGQILELPRPQYHISGWFYSETSQSSLRTIRVIDKVDNIIASVSVRAGMIWPTGTAKHTVASDSWHHISIDISRIRPVEKVANMQFCEWDIDTVACSEAYNTTHDVFFNNNQSDIRDSSGTLYKGNMLTVTPNIKTEKLNISGNIWLLNSVDIVNNCSYFTPPPVTLHNEYATFGYIYYEYTITIEIDDEEVFSGEPIVSTGTLDECSVEMVNNSPDNTDFRLEDVRIRNRRSSSICNIKDIIFSMGDEIEIQECTFSAKCYEKLSTINKFEMCEKNLKYAVPPEIVSVDARALAADMQWISYCDYAFPHALEYDDKEDVCEGLWMSISKNGEEADIFQIKSTIKTPMGVVYKNCTDPHCENVLQGFLSHINCNNKCSQATFIYLNDKDLEVSYDLYTGTTLLSVKIIDWNLVRCNSENDHVGIHTGDWVNKCAEIDNRFPFFECVPGRLTDEYDSIEKKTLGTGTTVSECRKHLKTSGESPTVVEMTGGECIALFDTENIKKYVTPIAYVLFDSGTPDLSLSFNDCGDYANTQGTTVTTSILSTLPNGCVTQNGVVYYKDASDNAPECGDIKCVQKVETCFIQYGGIPSVLKQFNSFTVPGCNTYPFDSNFFTDCFAKTDVYTATCSDTCVNRLRLEVDEKDCKKIENLRNISRLTGNECAKGACQEQLDTMVPKQFCAYQSQYHKIVTNGIVTTHSLLIPDLETTTCNDVCRNHLERALDYYEWEDWCLNYASGEILGLCSRTDCSCDAGYDGSQCELKCPMGSSDGKDATCSGTNGFCVPKDDSNVFEDKSRQDTAGEYDELRKTNYPPWLTGPTSVIGMCECVVGSGETCSLTCENNNNGTYGPTHTQQFGICDTYLAITKPMPVCSRYNSRAIGHDGTPVSYNSTTYDRARIINPERLIFCEDENMIDGASLTAYDDATTLSTNELKYDIIGIANDTGVGDDLFDESLEKHMKDATVVFQKICFPHPNDKILSFKTTDDTAKKYTHGPEYNVDNWRLKFNVEESQKNPTAPFTSMTLNADEIWRNSLSFKWVAQRLVGPKGGWFDTSLYYTVSHSYPNLTIEQCAFYAMQRYHETSGMFYMKDTECYMQKADKILTKTQWENDEPPMAGVSLKNSDAIAYFIDVDEIPVDKRAIKRHTSSPGHGVASTGVFMGISLWVEEMTPGSESVKFTASTESGSPTNCDIECDVDNVRFSHIITHGKLPYNRRKPGLVSIDTNVAIMFGGSLIFSLGYHDNGTASVTYEETSELFRLETDVFDFAGQDIVSVSISEPIISGTPPPPVSNPVMAFNGDRKIYIFGGTQKGSLYSLDMNIPTGVVAGETKRENWLWTNEKDIQYGSYDDSLRITAWARDSKIFMKDKELWIGSNVIAANEIVAATHESIIIHPRALELEVVTMGCDLTVSTNTPLDPNTLSRKITMGTETRPIAEFTIPIDLWKLWDSFIIWHHDWATIDVNFGVGFLIRYRNIFNVVTKQNEGLSAALRVSDAVPRSTRYVRINTLENLYNPYVVYVDFAAVSTGISIDECRNRCDSDESCTHFEHIEKPYPGKDGMCGLGVVGSYEKIPAKGMAVMDRDDYQSSFLKSVALENINTYFRRAKMMQGRYSVLDELGIGKITDDWQGYDWTIRREVGPGVTTEVPVSDGSKSVSIWCTSNNCARSSAAAFEKAKYTKKEALALCGVMDTNNCDEPCMATYLDSYQYTPDHGCEGELLHSLTTSECVTVCEDTIGCSGYTVSGTSCKLYRTCSLVVEANSGAYKKAIQCSVVESFTVSDMYYIVDFITPRIPQEETYRLVQGKNDFTIRVTYEMDSLKNFDTHPLCDGNVWTMSGRDIDIFVDNAKGLGGIRMLWSAIGGDGWLYKSRKPFQNYFVTQSIADASLHRGGTCGGSASELCPGVKTYYNVPCNGRGNCELSCECICDKSPEEYFYDSINTAGAAPDDPNGGAEAGAGALMNSPEKSPYRGPDCSITCPGFDGWSLENVCSGRGSCGDRGQCICDYGYTGDNCQFLCPGFDPLNKFESAGKICGKKGSCTIADISPLSYRTSEQKNKNRFLETLRSFYEKCHPEFKASGYELVENFSEQSDGEPDMSASRTDCEKHAAPQEVTMLDDDAPGPAGCVFDVMTSLYQYKNKGDVPCDATWKCILKTVDTHFSSILRKYVGQTCDSNDECHSKMCDTGGIYHGCENRCVQPFAETFPSKKGILMDYEPTRDGDLSPEWVNYNCPRHGDVWFNTQWLAIDGYVGSALFNGSVTSFTETVEGDADYKAVSSENDAFTQCEDRGDDCIGVYYNQLGGKYVYIIQTNEQQYLRESSSRRIWVKNPFTAPVNVFTSIMADIGTVKDTNGDKIKLSTILSGMNDGVCDIPPQQTSETPWVQRPMVQGFVQKYDEPIAEIKIGGYTHVYDWGFDPMTGTTTIRDLSPPTIVLESKCEIMPGFTLRCTICDCFSDSIQGYWDGPMCSACQRGYATKTCKKICPGYDGKNDNTMCSGNGVCIYGIEGSGRCMCGGGGGMPIFKDQDMRPVTSTEKWCNQFDTCDSQPYCQSNGGKICHTTQGSDTGDYTGESHPAIPASWPTVHEHPYYFVQYRDFSTFIWPSTNSIYYRYEDGNDVERPLSIGISRGNGFSPLPGIQGWHPDRTAIGKHYYNNVPVILELGSPFLEYSFSKNDFLLTAKLACDITYECAGVEKRTDGYYNVRDFSGWTRERSVGGPLTSLTGMTAAKCEEFAGDKWVADNTTHGPAGCSSKSNTARYHYGTDNSFKFTKYMNPGGLPDMSVSSSECTTAYLYQRTVADLALPGGCVTNDGAVFYNNLITPHGCEVTSTTTLQNVLPTPPVRALTTMVLSGDKMLVFGGYSEGYASLLNDFWSFDLNLGIWEQQSYLGALKPRSGHVAIMDGNDMVIFGGWGWGLYWWGGGYYLNDVWRYSPTGTFTELFTYSQTNSYPAGRDGAAGALWKNGSHSFMMFFGGYGYSGYKSDTWRLDLDSSPSWWVQLYEISYPNPYARSGAVMESIGNNIYMFGGGDQYGVLSDTWKATALSSLDDYIYWEKLSTPIRPSARRNMGGCAFDSTMYIFGGHGAQHYNDVWKFESETWVQIPIETGEAAPPLNSMPACVVKDNILFTYSGPTWDKDVWRLDEPSQTAAACLEWTNQNNAYYPKDPFEVSDTWVPHGCILHVSTGYTQFNNAQLSNHYYYVNDCDSARWKCVPGFNDYKWSIVTPPPKPRLHATGCLQKAIGMFRNVSLDTIGYPGITMNMRDCQEYATGLTFTSENSTTIPSGCTHPAHGVVWNDYALSLIKCTTDYPCVSVSLISSSECGVNGWSCVEKVDGNAFESWHKDRRGETGCIDFHICGDVDDVCENGHNTGLDEKGRWMGNNVYEGCCQCGGGLRGRGIPESMTRWLFSAEDAQQYTDTEETLSAVPRDIVSLGEGRKIVKSVSSAQYAHVIPYTVEIRKTGEPWISLECKNINSEGECVGDSQFLNNGIGNEIRISSTLSWYEEQTTHRNVDTIVWAGRPDGVITEAWCEELSEAKFVGSNWGYGNVHDTPNEPSGCIWIWQASGGGQYIYYYNRYVLEYHTGTQCGILDTYGKSMGCVNYLLEPHETLTEEECSRYAMDVDMPYEVDNCVKLFDCKIFENIQYGMNYNSASEELCKDYAQSIGHTFLTGDNIAEMDGGNYYPHGCSWEPRYAVYYNKATTSTKPCSYQYQCIQTEVHPYEEYIPPFDSLSHGECILFASQIKTPFAQVYDPSLPNGCIKHTTGEKDNYGYYKQQSWSVLFNDFESSIECSIENKCYTCPSRKQIECRPIGCSRTAYNVYFNARTSDTCGCNNDDASLCSKGAHTCVHRSSNDLDYTVHLVEERCINTYVDTVDLYLNIPGISSKLSVPDASLAVCHYICINGFPQQPDLSELTSSLTNDDVLSIYNGCCECSGSAQGRLSSFWHGRIDSDKHATSDPADSRWWSPRAYSSNDHGAKALLPMQYAHLSSRLLDYSSKNYAECPDRDRGQCENDCKLCKLSQSGYNCAVGCGGCLLGGTCDNRPTDDGVALCHCSSGALNPRAGCCPRGWSLLSNSDILRRKTTVTGIKPGLMVFFDQNRGINGDRSGGYYKDALYTGSGVVDDQIISNGFSAIDYDNLWDKRLQSGCYPCPGTMGGLGLCDNQPDENGKITCSLEDSESTSERMWALTSNFDVIGDNFIIQETPWYYKPQPRNFPFGYPPSEQYNEYDEFAGYGPALEATIHNVDAIVGNIGNADGYEDIEAAREFCDMTPECSYISQIPIFGIEKVSSGISNGAAALTKEQCIDYAADEKKTVTTLELDEIFERDDMVQIVETSTSAIKTHTLCEDIAKAKGYYFEQLGHIDMFWKLASTTSGELFDSEIGYNDKNSLITTIHQPFTIQYNKWTDIWRKLQVGTDYMYLNSETTMVSELDNEMFFHMRLLILVTDVYHFLFHRYTQEHCNVDGGCHRVDFQYRITPKTEWTTDDSMVTCYDVEVRFCPGFHNNMCIQYGSGYCGACTYSLKEECRPGRSSKGELNVPSNKLELTEGQIIEIKIKTQNRWYSKHQGSGFGFLWSSTKHTATPIYDKYYGRSYSNVQTDTGYVTGWEASFDTDKFALVNPVLPDGCFKVNNVLYWSYWLIPAIASRFNIIIPLNCFSNNGRIYYNRVSPHNNCGAEFECIHQQGKEMVSVTIDDSANLGDKLGEAPLEYCATWGRDNKFSVYWGQGNCYNLGNASCVAGSDASKKVLYNQRDELKERFYAFAEGELRKSLFHRTIVKRKHSNTMSYMSELSQKFSSTQIASGACGGDVNKCVPSMLDPEQNNHLSVSMFQARLSCKTCAISNIFSTYGASRTIEGVNRINYDLGHSYSTGCAKCLAGSGGMSAILRVYDYCYPQACGSIDKDDMRNWDDWADNAPDRNCNGLINSKCKNGQKFKFLNDIEFDPKSGCSHCPAGSGFGYDHDGDGIIDDPQFNLHSAEELNQEGQNSYLYIGDGYGHTVGNIATSDPYVFLSGHGQMHSDIQIKTIGCRPCPVNTFSTKTRNCLKCPSELSTLQKTGQTLCTSCSGGSFHATDIVEIDADRCIFCPAGMFVETDGVKTKSKTIPNGWGVEHDGWDPTVSQYDQLPSWGKGLGGCTSCPPGKYNPNTGSDNCIDCPSGYRGTDVQDGSHTDGLISWLHESGIMPRTTFAVGCELCPTYAPCSAPGAKFCQSCS